MQVLRYLGVVKGNEDILRIQSEAKRNNLLDLADVNNPRKSQNIMMRTDSENILYSGALSTITNNTRGPVTAGKVGTQANINKRLDYFLDMAEQMRIEAFSFTKLLEQARQDCNTSQSRNLDILNTTENTLSLSMLKMSTDMSDLMKRQSNLRLLEISSNTAALTSNFTKLNSRVKLLKQRVCRVQNTLGYYTAHETHL